MKLIKRIKVWLDYRKRYYLEKKKNKRLLKEIQELKRLMDDNLDLKMCGLVTKIGYHIIRKIFR